MRSKIQKKIAYCLLFGEKETNWQVPERRRQPGDGCRPDRLHHSDGRSDRAAADRGRGEG